MMMSPRSGWPEDRVKQVEVKPTGPDLIFRGGYTNIRSMPVACALIPRFRLIAAITDRGILRRPAALAPEPGAAQLIGEVTAAAERFGLRAGMRMGEALSRCPELALIPPDSERAERFWE